ncbi:MAG TPA: tetratricopeptide repeat protein [Rectinemataceae bacterium]|nr:tetratricopeptide repeat protein [Rectinemataceae bacterium]
MKRPLVAALSGILFLFTTLGIAAQAAGATAAPAAVPAQSADSLAAYSKASPACLAVLAKAQALRNAGKWRAAFDTLATFDPNNKDPFALAMETRLCIDGFIQSEQFQSFTLIDLATGQTLDAARESGSDAPSLPFDPPTLAAALVKTGISLPPVLSKVLGDYYYSAQIEYSGNWIMSDDDAYAKALENYQAAYAGGVFDADSLQNLAELLMRTNRTAEAAPIFQKSIDLNPGSPTARYNYAICLLRQGDRTGALDQLDKALALFTDPQPQFDTLSLAARTAADAGDPARSEAYLKRADALSPDAPNAGVLRHEIAVEHGNPAGANAAADALMPKYASNPGVVRALISTWYSNGDPASARAFLERSIGATSDDKSIGTLQFYLAILLVQGTPSDADMKTALSTIDAAVAHMEKVMDPSDQFFAIAQQLRDHISPPATPEATPQASPPTQASSPAAPAPTTP